MLILRCTTKAFKKFSQKPRLIEFDKAEKDFGQWYVNSVESVNQGDLFMLVMHTESLYSLLVPIEESIEVSDFVHSFFAHMLLCLLQVEIPRKNAEQIVASYNGHAVLAKTNSKSLVANLATIVKEIDAIMEWPESFVRGNQLDLTRLGHRINDVPRGLDGKTVWPLNAFYSCIRKFCPELPIRQTLPLESIGLSKPQKVMAIFDGQFSKHLTMKVKASIFGADVLFDIEETRTILKAVDKSQSKMSETLFVNLKRMLRYQLEKRQKEI